jgi:hypothetical protein
VGKYVNQVDLERALSASAVAYIYTDPGLGQVDTEAIALNVDRAEAEVDSWMLPEVDETSPGFIQTDRLVRGCALDFLICFSYEKHPEYVRTFGDDPRTMPMWKRAVERMERIQQATQRLPDQQAVKQKNVGGVYLDDSIRTCSTSINGRRNGDGF